ncbi:TPA: glycosyltransferase family 2 protein [Elizabethkingia anophelis]|uniref:glycosyltransferase family 2 protein n=1 Tax=Elizabethkingia anophelis TaxID=1117645 RepID=UPI0004185CAB|nr:glycosyltransferase family 2 protein [Elizabethkingia anophelis]MCT3744824.1 glycosyltransferase family 2 protein [Elizabethkingia anophelis]MDC8027633.1 glycosyltransferase family 2 protein [Elizabethkingia anophelis]MDV3490010.1 glycosyltransferase family 2 protein [Elizabethkingia anophelis]HAT3991927.1 glycosyltransferase family 2 protein [Elizabethkingia anophelis]HAT3995640.1 glycosyltransferase family 2 protein [Elizabethkingia anophelis]
MNTDYPLVSIIIPCYNASYYLKEVLESIKLQSYPNIECIAINDGSTDNTLDILNTFSDSQFHIYNQENRGLSDTRNLGMEKATGDFIFFCDSDDILPTNAIESLVSAYTGKENIIIGKTANYAWETKKIDSHLPHPKEKQYFANKNAEVLIQNISKGLSPIAQNKLYNSKFLKEKSLKFLSGIYHEDELWFFETMFTAENILFIPDVTYYYTMDNSQSITKNHNDRNLIGYLSVIETIYKKYYLEFPQKSITAYYLSHLKKIVMGNYKHYSSYSNEALHKMEQIFQETNSKFNEDIKLKKIEKLYFRYINTVGLKDIASIRKEYFNSPVNSLGKRFKLFKFKLFNKL